MGTPQITWDDIIQQDMLGPNNVSHMVVYQMDTKVLLGSTKGYWLPPEDLDQCFRALSDPENALINGLTLWKRFPETTCEFLVAKADSRSFYCKRGATSCFGGRSIAGTFVLLFAEPPVLPGRTANSLELLLDYLNELAV